MKYTLNGFSQEVALTFKKNIPAKDGKEKTIKIDCTDLTILRWFVDFYPNMRKMTVDGKEYAMLTHKKLLDDLPILDITKRSCVERMQKLVEFEILEYTLVKEGGTFSLYRFGKNYEMLISSDGTRSTVYGYTVENTQGMQSTDIGGIRSTNIGVHGQPDNKDNSIINSSINDSSIKNKQKHSVFDDLIADYSKGNEEITDLLQEWLKVRKAKRAAMTDRAIKMNIEKLDKLSKQSGMTVVEYLKEVICRGWAAFYPITNYGANNKSGKVYGATGVEIKPNAVDDLAEVF